ncbi:MAG: DUF3592 domain-containing protein [Acidobacteriota bacterium]
MNAVALAWGLRLYSESATNSSAASLYSHVMLPASRFLPQHAGSFLRLALDIAPLLIAAAVGLRTWMKHRAAQSWPTTSGIIWSARSRPARRGERGRWVAELTFSYALDGQYYSGTRDLRARNEADADKIAAEWKGREVSVRYSPSDAETSVVLLEDQPVGTLLHLQSD